MRRVSLWVAVLALVGLIGAASAQARLDSSFGEGGVLRLVGPPVPSGGTTGSPMAVYPAPDGSYYVGAWQSPCHECRWGFWVAKFGPDGTLQADFGGGHGYEMPQIGEFVMPLATAVDSAGRLVYAGHRSSSTGDELVVQRVTSTGDLDGAFGYGGSVGIPCHKTCGEVTLLPGARNSILVALRGYGGPSYELRKPFLTLVDLNAYGLPTKQFGAKLTRIPSRAAFQYAARTPRGGLYYGGPESIERISAKGRKDTRFARNAAIAIRRIGRDAGAGVQSLVVAADGKIELFGWLGRTAGFELRLLPSGKLDRGFGREGLRRFPFSVPAAVRGRGGATMVLGSTEYQEPGAIPRVYRILESGRIDPAFGKKGEELPGAPWNETGYELAPAGKGRVSVIDLGLSFCRQQCRQEPKMYRFLEGK